MKKYDFDRPIVRVSDALAFIYEAERGGFPAADAERPPWGINGSKLVLATLLVRSFSNPFEVVSYLRETPTVPLGLSVPSVLNEYAKASIWERARFEIADALEERIPRLDLRNEDGSPRGVFRCVGCGGYSRNLHDAYWYWRDDKDEMEHKCSAVIDVHGQVHLNNPNIYPCERVSMKDPTRGGARRLERSGETDLKSSATLGQAANFAVSSTVEKHELVDTVPVKSGGELYGELLTTPNPSLKEIEARLEGRPVVQHEEPELCTVDPNDVHAMSACATDEKGRICGRSKTLNMTKPVTVWDVAKLIHDFPEDYELEDVYRTIVSLSEKLDEVGSDTKGADLSTKIHVVLGDYRGAVSGREFWKREAELLSRKLDHARDQHRREIAAWSEKYEKLRSNKPTSVSPNPT